MNSQFVSGLIKTNVELRHTQSDVPVLTILVQSVDVCKNARGEMHHRRNMHSVKFWGELARSVAKEYIKEDHIILVGRSETKKKTIVFPDSTKTRTYYDTVVVAEKVEPNQNVEYLHES